MLHWTPGRLLCFVSDATSPAPVSTVVGQHDIHMTGNDIIRSAFDPVAGLPCWQVLGEFGTYLTFHFGIPKVHVTEPTEAIRHRRLAGVDGQYELCLAAYQWVAFQDGERVAQSESPRDVIRKVAATFLGQKLTAPTVRTKPAGGEFVFDLGGRLAYQVRDADEQTLWTFRTRLDPDPDDVDIVSFTAAGTVSLFTLRGTVHEPREYVQETKDYMLQDRALGVQLGAAPNGGPATVSGNAGVTGGPPSVS